MHLPLNIQILQIFYFTIARQVRLVRNNHRLILRITKHQRIYFEIIYFRDCM